MISLNKGQRVKLNLEGTVKHAGIDYARLTLEGGDELYVEFPGAPCPLEIVSDPFPTEPGIYAHRNSFTEVQASATILQLNHSGIWTNRTDNAYEAKALAQLWHDNGVLVKLGVAE